MTPTHRSSGVAALLGILFLVPVFAIASEITGTLSATEATAPASDLTSGTLGGTVTTASSGGGGGGVTSGGGGNGPPIAQGAPLIGATVAASPAGTPGSGTGTNNTAPEPSYQAPSRGTVLGAATAAPKARAAASRSVALAEATTSVAAVITSDTVVAPAKEVENPSQLGAVMSSLASGDISTWIWALFFLALIIGGAAYLFTRYENRLQEAQ